MEKAYYLIVERQAGTTSLRSLDDYPRAELLINDAADYEAGEFPGRWVGALELQFDQSGRLQEVRSVDDLGNRVQTELASRADWRRRQSVAGRWASR